MQTLLLTLLALVALAANAVLNRAATVEGDIDAGAFAAIRIASGALALWMLESLRHRRQEKSEPRAPLPGNWSGALFLFLYVVPVAFAYSRLPVGTGALLLVGAVQVTMIGAGLALGERLSFVRWVGVTLALCGLVYLALPGVGAPALLPAVLMLGSGVAWGFYSLHGRGAGDPLSRTTGSFLRAAPLTVGAGALAIAIGLSPLSAPTTKGLTLALASGVLASGLGYAVWYAVLPRLQATVASTAQLTVPILAALGGVLFIGEPITLRLLLSGTLVLGGVSVAIVCKQGNASANSRSSTGQAADR